MALHFHSGPMGSPSFSRSILRVIWELRTLHSSTSPSLSYLNTANSVPPSKHLRLNNLIKGNTETSEDKERPREMEYNVGVLFSVQNLHELYYVLPRIFRSLQWYTPSLSKRKWFVSGSVGGVFLSQPLKASSPWESSHLWQWLMGISNGVLNLTIPSSQERQQGGPLPKTPTQQPWWPTQCLPTRSPNPLLTCTSLFRFISNRYHLRYIWEGP